MPKKYLKSAGKGAIIGVGLVIIAHLLIKKFGFTPDGVAADSIAAALQIPRVVAGSLFACLQSIGATLALIKPKVLFSFAGIGAIICVLKLIKERRR